MYFVSKTKAEQAAWEFAKENNIDFVCIIPSLVVGPFLMSSMPPSSITALSPITGQESHYHIIKEGQFVHLNDLCLGHIFLFEHPKAEGRYICSSHNASIFYIARNLRKNTPSIDFQQSKFKGKDEKDLKEIVFSSKKIKDLGFEFKYSLEDMFTGAVNTCRAKGLLPLSYEKKDVNGTA
ncbi:hypothetical protein SLEP1_g48099 [Rubroshorea leprosula]|uniref:Flavanone 4-reductase n=1 Tax=Rubroshorea leprosula TaxID=152421 RepID=A0AAV5LTM1_9ROSI|nr:hypothetical protein SLEP1_g48099 [Rubroshorea leprosula]